MNVDLIGRVHHETSGDLRKVVCPNAPRHLQVMWLQPWQLRSAREGDQVRLSYRVTASSGNWVVAEVLV